MAEAAVKSLYYPITNNESVQQLFEIMQRNNNPAVNELIAVVLQISAMERYLETTVKELAAMRVQLDDIQAQKHPVINALQKAIAIAQEHVIGLREKLAGLKLSIVNGCKNAVSAFKENGISALDNLSRFFKIRPALESLRSELDHCIKLDDKAIAKIETASIEYHQVGLHLKNMCRSIIGKEPIQEAKPIGKIAKTLSAPFRAKRKCFASMKKCTETAIISLVRLKKITGEKEELLAGIH